MPNVVHIVDLCMCGRTDIYFQGRIQEGGVGNTLPRKTYVIKNSRLLTLYMYITDGPHHR